MIGIIDYGAGNLNSVMRAVKKLGYEARIISSVQEINEADAYILPGVGAFSKAMEAIEPFKDALIDNIKKANIFWVYVLVCSSSLTRAMRMGNMKV